jgi:hypothetical protein
MTVTFSPSFFLSTVLTTPELNMSNVNAREILATLGLQDDDDLCGETSADDFMGRVLMALAVAPADAGMPTYDDSTYNEDGSRIGAQYIRCGRVENYTQIKLTELHEIAEWAQRNETTVSWG